MFANLPTRASASFSRFKVGFQASGEILSLMGLQVVGVNYPGAW